jgi:hypothetical protein
MKDGIFGVGRNGMIIFFQVFGLSKQCAMHMHIYKRMISFQ